MAVQSGSSRTIDLWIILFVQILVMNLSNLVSIMLLLLVEPITQK